ncbi:hypothetical protein [Phocaeicola sartorii]|uniref:hypothetical protein n=1 Tax=Phocaeicola sartorii TaxID=671267 RepID=UPI00248C2F0E|nr:hypothetical protein [Phocaeicola sartorii]
MKQHIIFSTILMAFISLASCSDDIDSTNNTSVNPSQNKEGNIIIQKRNPNLPEIKKLELDKSKNRSNISGETGNSDAFLGSSYKFKNGNYILGDFSNVGYPIVDLSAVKAYDPTYIRGIRLNTTETTSFAYATFDRYQHNSRVTKKVSSGFSLNFKVFSFGRKKTTTETFNKVIDNTEQATYGELNINFTNNQFSLQNSEANRKLYARQFLTKSFIRSLYNSPISSTLSTYGDFVLTGYLTGGKAHATYAGTSTDNISIDAKEKGIEESINASLAFKQNPGDSAKANLGFTSNNYDSVSTTFKSQNTFIYIKTFGGIRNGSEAEVKATPIKNLNINLTSWMNSLNDVSTHTMIDVADEGLCPLSDFVLEKNFKQRFDDTFNEVLPSYTSLVYPYIEIVRVMVRSTPSYEALYDVAAVLVTRQADRIILSDGLASSATDAELRKNEDNTIFMQKVDKIAAEKSKLFSSDIEISYNKKTRLNPVLRSPLCIDLAGFKEKNFYRFYYEKTGIEYIYDPSSRICFSYFIDEGDDEVLDIYGIRNWVESLPEKKISIASLANSYKIIGL